jgi:quercetin dioxygenase-like cupin family protein
MVVNYKSAKVSQPVSGITRRILAHSSELMLTEHILEKGAVLPEHQHSHVQLVYLVSGELLIEMDGKRFTMKKGDSLAIPSNLNHKATALRESVALDIFAPARADYL